MCTNYTTRLEAVSMPSNVAGVAAYLDRVLSLARANSSRLHAIAPPSGKKQAYVEYLAGVDHEVSVIQQADTEARNGAVGNALSLLERESALSQQDGAKARALGLRQCTKA